MRILLMLLLFALPLQAQNGAVYHLDTPNPLLDSSGAGNHLLTIDGAALVPGYQGTALRFSGNDTDRAVVPSTVFNGFGNTAYFSAWIRPNSYHGPDGSYIFRKVADFNDFWAWMSSSGSLNCLLYNSGVSGSHAQAQGGTIPLNVWSKVSCYYDGTTMHASINDVEVATAFFPLAGINWFHSYIITEIGNATPHNFNHDYGFQGDIDEVVIAPAPPTIQSPVELLTELVDNVIALNLKTGISNSLEAKLTAALNALDNARSHDNIAAINALNAFINAVLAQRGNLIPTTEADMLITRAQRIIGLLTP